MTIYDLITGMFPEVMENDCGYASNHTPVQLQGTWKGTLKQLKDLEVDMSMVIYERKEGLRIFITEDKDDEHAKRI